MAMPWDPLGENHVIKCYKLLGRDIQHWAPPHSSEIVEKDVHPLICARLCVVNHLVVFAVHQVVSHQHDQPLCLYITNVHEL